MATPATQKALSPQSVRAILFGLMLAQMLAALDSTIVGPAMSTIGRDLGDVAHLPWIVTAYLLVSTTLTPLYGKLSDIYGRRVLLLIAIGAFVAGSIACALSPSMNALAAARGFQGIGGAGITAMTMTIMADIVPPRERPKYQVYVSLVWVTANLAGPVLGGYIAGQLHWSIIFWINAPLGLAALAFTSGRLKAMPRHEKPHKLDFLGAALLMSASALLMLALSWGGQEHARSSARAFDLLAASAMCWILLVWRQMTASEPLIPLSVLRNKVVLAGSAAMGFTMASYIGLAIYTPLFFQSSAGLSVAAAGAATMPLMLGTTVTASGAGRAMNRLKRYWRLPRAGLALAALASCALAFAGPSWPLFALEIPMTLIAFGVGPIFPVINVSVQAAVSGHELGTSMSLLTFLRNIGAALGVAAFGAVVVANISASQGGGANAALHVEAGGFRALFLIAAAGFALAFLSIALVREPNLAEQRIAEPASAAD